MHLSFKNIKLANFIELELTDLMDSIQQIHGDNYRNQLKENLARSYNVFREMQQLFGDLNMGFLYQQVKKLVSCYGLIFMLFTEKLEQLTPKL
jgi:hypothetical protein